MLEARIKFYDILHCGYYRRGRPDLMLSGIADSLSKIQAWGENIPELINRKTFQGNAEEDVFSSYFCHSHTSSNGDVLMSFWNEVANDNGVIYGMDSNAPPGGTSIESSSFNSDGVIPGFPSYFWFIPHLEKFASISFAHSVSGKSQLDNFFNGYLNNYSPYRVKDEDDNIIGYSENRQRNNESAYLKPSFKALGTKYSEVERELITKVSSITKMVKREDISYAVAEHRSLIERIFSGLASDITLEGTRRVLHEIQFRPTVEQLRTIISNFNERETDTTIRNAGFVLSDGKRIMLKGLNVSFSHDLRVRRVDNQMLSSERLLNAIQTERSDLLRALDDPDRGNGGNDG